MGAVFQWPLEVLQKKSVSRVGFPCTRSDRPRSDASVSDALQGHSDWPHVTCSGMMESGSIPLAPLAQ